MKISFLSVFLFYSLSTLALEESFSEICGPTVQAKDCLEYEQRGMAYIICRWWHFFPSLRELELISQRNPIYVFSKSYCDAWLTSVDSALIPDVEGNYCKDKNELLDPAVLFESDKKRAYLCAKHKQAENYLRAKALETILKVISNSSQAILPNIQQAQEFFVTNKQTIEEQFSHIFALDYAFPSQKNNARWLGSGLWFW